jgi:hypothetical protein
MQKLFTIPTRIHKGNFSKVMEQAITLELATIPTYLSTYYSINRAPSQEALLKTITSKMESPSEGLAKELTLDVLVYANKTAALIMGVLIEEMLHLALSSNVKQAICKESPNLMGIAKVLKFPTQLDGHRPEFKINLGPLSIEQLTTFLKIESPNHFGKSDKPVGAKKVQYTTIGEFYAQIEKLIKKEFPGKYKLGDRLQLTASPKMAIYSPNSINTVYYDRDHNPHFINDDESGGLIHVTDCKSALAALDEIVEQGEGSSVEDHDKLELDAYGNPIPLPVVDGKVVFKKGDYDDTAGKKKAKSKSSKVVEEKELAHFDKFLEAYSLGHYYQEKFAGYGLDFFSLFVHNQDQNPKIQDYKNSIKVEVADSAKEYYDTDEPRKALVALAKLSSAVFSYILLMIEACYEAKSKDAQFQIFMFGVHKSMIWLLSQYGRDLTSLQYMKEGKMYTGALTFEDYDFSKKDERPKKQLIDLAHKAAKHWPKKEKWAVDGKYPNYFPALPDVGLDYSYKLVDYSKDAPKSGGKCPAGH